VLDYLAYGDPRVLRESSQDRLTQRYTGKEYDALMRFHYFGARYFDSELGIWITPDPLGQFHNPYTNGSDPVRLEDRDGQFLFVVVIIGVVVGAYLGGSAANGTFDPTKWDYKSADTWIGLGVGGLLGGLSGGALAGGAALGTGTILGGALYGAGLGGGAAYAWSAVGQTQSGQFDVGGLFKAWGLGAAVGAASGAAGVLGGGGNWFTKSLLNSGLETAKALMNGDNLWKAAAVGFAIGVFNNTGGFQLATTGWAGRLGFQGIATAGASIGRNWAAGRDLFSKVNIGFGPINFVVGTQATLQDQLSANYYNLALNGLGFANLIAGGDVRWSWSNQTFSYSGGLLNPLSFGFNGHTGLGVLLGWGTAGNALGSANEAHELVHLWQSRAYGIDQFFTLWAVSGGPDRSWPGGDYYEHQADTGY
jgi:RHS repeat-associated protein